MKFYRNSWKNDVTKISTFSILFLVQIYSSPLDVEIAHVVWSFSASNLPHLSCTSNRTSKTSTHRDDIWQTPSILMCNLKRDDNLQIIFGKPF